MAYIWRKPNIMDIVNQSLKISNIAVILVTQDVYLCRETTCLLSIRIPLACTWAAKLTITNIYMILIFCWLPVNSHVSIFYVLYSWIYSVISLFPTTSCCTWQSFTLLLGISSRKGPETFRIRNTILRASPWIDSTPNDGGPMLRLVASIYLD